MSAVRRRSKGAAVKGAACCLLTPSVLRRAFSKEPLVSSSLHRLFVPLIAAAAASPAGGTPHTHISMHMHKPLSLFFSSAAGAPKSVLISNVLFSFRAAKRNRTRYYQTLKGNSIWRLLARFADGYAVFTH